MKQECELILLIVKIKLGFGGVISIYGTPGSEGVYVHPYEKSGFKKALIKEAFCKRAGVWIADKDTIVNKSEYWEKQKGTSEFFLLCLFIAP